MKKFDMNKFADDMTKERFLEIAGVEQLNEANANDPDPGPWTRRDPKDMAYEAYRTINQANQKLRELVSDLQGNPNAPQGRAESVERARQHFAQGLDELNNAFRSFSAQ